MKRPPKPRGPKFAWRRFARTCARWLFFLGSVAFLIHFAHDITTQASNFHRLRVTASLLGTGLAALITSLASLTSAVGWNLLLKDMGSAATLRQSAAVYCSTQIAKYLPGNVGHYIGRVALAKTRLQIGTAAAVLSLLQEAALACLGAVFVGLFCYFFFPDRALYGLPRTALYTGFALLAIAYVSVSTGAGVLRENANVRPAMLRKAARAIPTLKTGSKALPFYIAGYVCVGIAASVIAAGAIRMETQDFVFIIGAYSLAWIVGFLIPGAPGGLGVRESALVLLLAGTYPKDTVLMIALLARLASVGADLITFAAGLLLMRTSNTSKKLSTKNCH